MKVDNRATIEEVSWKSVSRQVKAIAPDIYEAIEQLELTPNSDYKLYKIRYPYGATILGKNGAFQVPNSQGQLVPLSDSSLNPKFQEKIGYNWGGMPMSLIMSGQVDLFLHKNYAQTETSKIYKSGVVAALWTVLDPPRSYQARYFWGMTSGTHAPYMLPGIADDASFERLKKFFNLRTLHKPLTQHEHYKLFVELANHEAFSVPWFSEILVFSREWLTPRKDTAWKLFRLALLERAWAASSFTRNTFIVNKIWDMFILEIRNKRVNNFITAMSKYIIGAGLGEVTVHTIADETNAAGPFNEITSLFLDVYQIKKYAPLILVTDNFDRNNGRVGFVSIQMSNDALNAKKDTYRNSKMIADMREVRYVINQFIDKIHNGQLSVRDTPFVELEKLNFDFYHADEDKFNELLPANTIFDGVELAEKWKKRSQNNLMPYRNGFTRACVKIMPR